MRLQSFLIGRLQALEELLRLPTEVTVEAPVTPADRKHQDELWEGGSTPPPVDTMNWVTNITLALLPGYGASLGVGVMDPFLYRLH